VKSSYVILESPVVTERSTILSDRKENPQYVFRVARTANKIEIRRAVEEIFRVKVKNVNTLTVKGKLRRQGRTAGLTSTWKKAFVILEPGQVIRQDSEL
jgi:large subunit ribosomal protein L23